MLQTYKVFTVFARREFPRGPWEMTHFDRKSGWEVGLNPSRVDVRDIFNQLKNLKILDEKKRLDKLALNRVEGGFIILVSDSGKPILYLTPVLGLKEPSVAKPTA